jgi:aminoglycoside 6'-N-acetyltransferase I
MRTALWPDQTERDMDEWLARPDAAIVVAEREESGLCGFAEVGARAYADGCLTSPVAYLEGWWVDADRRGRGVGRALVRAAESWARSRGHREMASDALLDNIGSHRAHERLGFAEVERVVLFRKDL